MLLVFTIRPRPTPTRLPRLRLKEPELLSLPLSSCIIHICCEVETGSRERERVDHGMNRAIETLSFRYVRAHDRSFASHAELRPHLLPLPQQRLL